MVLYFQKKVNKLALENIHTAFLINFIKHYEPYIAQLKIPTGKHASVYLANKVMFVEQTKTLQQNKQQDVIKEGMISQ